MPPANVPDGSSAHARPSSPSSAIPDANPLSTAPPGSTALPTASSAAPSSSTATPAASSAAGSATAASPASAAPPAASTTPPAIASAAGSATAASPASTAPPATSSVPAPVHPASSSCLRLDGAPGPSLEGLLPNIHVSVPPLDRPTIRSSLTAIVAALDREDAFQELQRSYSDLLGAHFALRRRVTRLEHELGEAARSAAPFVAFAQSRYDRLRDRLLESERIAAERLHALEETEGDAREIQRLRGRLRYEEGVHQEAVQSFHSQIAGLEQDLRAARAQAPQARSSGPDALLLQVQLNEVNAARLLAGQELAQAQDQVRALETSQNALEASTRILRQQVSTLERRTTELRQDQTRSKRVLGQSLQERDRLQGLLDQSDLDLQGKMAELQRVCQERDRIRRDSSRHRDQVAAARTAVARLERRTNDLQQGAAASQNLRDENVRLQASLRSALREQQQALADRDRAIAERDDARGRLSSVLSVIQADPSVSEPPSPQSSLGKRRKSRSPRGSPEKRSSAKSSRPSPRQSRPVANTSKAPSGNQDEDLLAALSRSRWESRRPQASSSRKPQIGTPRRPIRVDPPSPDGSDPGSSSSSSGSHHSGGSGSHQSRSPTESGSGDDGSSDAQSDSSVNSVLSEDAFDQLDTTVVPRSEWIPGYRDPVDFAQRDVGPWPTRELCTLSVRRLNVEMLFHQWCRPDFWLFPKREPAPPAKLWNPELITSAGVRALYKAEPWNVLDRDVAPRSFNLTGWYERIAHVYLAFEDEFRQVYWEATHKLPITKKMKGAHPFLASLSEGRKQRRSHVGPRWKTLLKHFLAGILAGHCDLDFFLDPFFLHFPRTTEQGFWYPGLGTNRAPADLDAALVAIDLAEPWRNQFRKSLSDHPGNQIARLDGKFRLAADSD